MHLVGSPWGHARRVTRSGAPNQVTSPMHKKEVLTESQGKATFKACYTEGLVASLALFTAVDIGN